MKVIALDLGATKLKGALIENGKIKRELEERIIKNKAGLKQQLLSFISRLKEGLKEEELIIVVGSPGPLDPEKGTILSSPNMPFFRNVNYKQFIGKAFPGAKVLVENDANLAALGEARARKAKNLVALTLGTGIGAGLVLNGKLWTGTGAASEFGHHVIKFDSKFKCGCGRKGCFEVYASSRTLVRLAKQHKLKVKDSNEISRLAKSGNKNAKKIYDEFAFFLGIGLANLINGLAPELIVIGGGIAKDWQLFLPKAAQVAKQEAFKPIAKKARIEPFKLKDKAALFGGWWYALEQKKAGF